jgi:hypothetical protein
MKKAIAIGMLGLALVSNRAVAQTAVEQAQILRDFERSVVEYTQRHQCLVLPEAINAATPAPKIFTLPVAMVFRQRLGHALAGGDAAIGGGGVPSHRAMVLQPFPTNELYDFPVVFARVLPALPPTLEYRLIGNDLVIRDITADVIVGVLRDALGTVTTR